ncbi:hypothetical protein HDU96_008283 [Phlyctochytrium bullatum]|nr:hypothetical protein HDU96_008283 [Phlyctochytrium bullatum]
MLHAITDPDAPAILRINVGGIIMETTSWHHALTDLYPSSKLATAIRRVLSTPPPKGGAPYELFLDANPSAFTVLLDHLRHPHHPLPCPPTVPLDLVLLLARNLLHPHSLPATATALHHPPPYTPGDTKTPAPSTAEAAATTRLTTWSHTTLLPHLTHHARLGHRHLHLILAPTPVTTTSPDSLLFLSETPETPVLRDFLAVNDHDVAWLRGVGVETVEKAVVESCKVRRCKVRMEEVRVRRESGFGLVESRAVAVVVLDVELI